MSKQRKIDYHEHEPLPEGTFPGVSDVASATECTGLMYRVPMDSAELDACQQLSPMEIPRQAQDGDEAVQHALHRAATPQEAARAVEKASGRKQP